LVFIDSAAVEQQLLDRLAEWIAIPSISADVAHEADVLRAGEWLCERIRAAGGESELADWEGHPLALGELRASSGADAAPTVLCYGHFDVQPPDPLELWETPPFEASVRNGQVFGRGVADDKGQLFLLLEAASRLALAGELPVNVRFACDGEEETGGHSIVDYLAADERGADVCVIFDSGMVARDVPAFNIATRGMSYFHLTLRTGERDLHSGIYGGAALNALSALTRILQAVLPGEDGRLPEPLRRGIVPPSEEERAAWSELPTGAHELASQGARPLDPGAAEEFYLRTWAEPAVDVHGIAGGSPLLQKTVLPVEAVANVSIRLAPGQDPAEIAPELERLLREATPEGAELTVERWAWSEPGLVDQSSQPIQLALDAFERVLGVRPLLIRSGGTLPIVPALATKGIPTVLTGFALPDSNIHSPNERMELEYLPKGIEAAKELFTSFAELRSTAAGFRTG
jgi:acetylornithine deacetylase/succinyl-diaminopimelate desuccinylase-like protein